MKCAYNEKELWPYMMQVKYSCVMLAKQLITRKIRQMDELTLRFYKLLVLPKNFQFVDSYFWFELQMAIVEKVIN